MKGFALLCRGIELNYLSLNLMCWLVFTLLMNMFDILFSIFVYTFKEQIAQEMRNVSLVGTFNVIDVMSSITVKMLKNKTKVHCGSYDGATNVIISFIFRILF